MYGIPFRDNLMGGIGKTTLATNAYNHQRITSNFDVKAWVTISQEFTVGKIIRPLLRDLGVHDVDKIDDNELGVRLHKCLFRRKYLVILDDIWDSQAWDEINRFFPDDNNKSRILLTTRILDVGCLVGSCSPFDIELLDDDRSWELLSNKVFGEEACPPELEECGKKISDSCKGLPLSIVVIGGLLKTSAKTNECREDVAENICSTISREDGERCLKILSLSYDQLPIHLKPCFLYLATYPYDCEIHVSKLIRLWVADGFLRPTVGDFTLEEVALQYLKELGNRNLIIVKKLNFKGEMEHFAVHDLVMDLCTREVQKERFLYVDQGGEELSETIESQRRLVFHGSGYVNMQLKGFSRSYISFIDQDPNNISRLRLLRSCVLPGYIWREYLGQLVNLRLLEISVGPNNPDWLKILSLLWNLETLIVTTQYNLPPETWNLRNIKHLIFRGPIILLDPPTNDADLKLQKLQTLEGVEILSDWVLDMIPNIKKLVISYVHQKDAKLVHGFGNLSHCHKLEILHINMVDCMHLKNIKFSESLRKLTLYLCHIPWTKCNIGLLPNLESFTIHGTPFDVKTWNTVEGEFKKLKTLSIYRCGLKSWTMEDCFPILEHLILTREWYLEVIPEVFSESMTLQSIKLLECSHSADMSAKQILDERERQGQL